MSSPVPEDQKIIAEYFKVLENRILEPIEKTGIREYCTATLLILFAAIDGLGKLLHLDDDADPNARIKCFLVYMRGDYEAHQEKLVNLRNSLVHNALNLKSLLSQAISDEGFHLKLPPNGDGSLIFVNTNVMYRDFVGAFKRFQGDIATDPVLKQRAYHRLKRVSAVQWDESNGPAPSPAPVQFVEAKKRRRRHRVMGDSRT